MAGPLDYLRWRGDLRFKEKPFNSVDASLLSSIAYLPADSSATNHTLGEVAEKLRNLSSFQHQMYAETATEVMLLPESPRIG
ncbi:MAG: esterase, partial [Lactobacillus sp.]|nr:esterase [Lactobacillus sp.]